MHHEINSFETFRHKKSAVIRAALFFVNDIDYAGIKCVSLPSESVNHNSLFFKRKILVESVTEKPPTEKVIKIDSLSSLNSQVPSVV